VRHSRRNVHRIADSNLHAGFAKAHGSRALRDVIQLFAHQVPVQLRFLTRPDDCLGQTLSGITVNDRMHQFADFRAVLGDVGRDGLIADFHALSHLKSHYDARRIKRV
jgi:hypothetical protein